jgi:hypothetical protein
MLTVAAADLRHHLTIHADADPSALARIVAPFVIHDVLPARLNAGPDASGKGYVVSVELVCPGEVAERLAQRIAAMPVVRQVTSSVVPGQSCAA